MKYYEIEYDNKAQKALWILEAIVASAFIPLILSFLLFGFLFFIDVTPSGISLIIVGLFVLLGVGVLIYNLTKTKGIFVFDNYIEIISYHFIKRKIHIGDIYEIQQCENMPYNLYTLNYTFSPSVGGRRNCISISTAKTIFSVKAKNQDELIKDLKKFVRTV